MVVTGALNVLVVLSIHVIVSPLLVARRPPDKKAQAKLTDKPMIVMRVIVNSNPRFPSSRRRGELSNHIARTAGDLIGDSGLLVVVSPYYTKVDTLKSFVLGSPT